MAVPAGRLMRARRLRLAPGGQAVLGVVLAGLAFALTEVFATQGAARTIAVLVVVLGSVWFACTRNTGRALSLLMLYLGLLDGYLKLSSGSSYVTLVRDVLLYAIVAGILVRSRVDGGEFKVPPLSGWVISYVVLVLVQIANPNGGTLTHSLAGVRPHLEFAPLFFLGYMIVRDVPTLRRFVMLLLVVAAANGIVSFLQFHLTPDQLAGWGPGYSNIVNGNGAFLGGARTFVDASGLQRVRPLGLGSDAGAGGVFGVVALGGVIALSSLLVGLRYRILAVIGGVGAVAAIVTSEGRGVIVAAVVTVLAYGLLTATSQRRVASLAGLAVAAAVAYLVVTSLTAGAGGGAFRYQGLSASKILSTTSSAGGRQGQIQAILSNITAYPLGAGLGTAGPASATAGRSAISATLNAESEFAFLDLEVGVPGLIVLVGLSLSLLGLGLARCRREPDPQARILLAAVISPVAGIVVGFYGGGASTTTVPTGPFLWFLAGVIAYWLVTLPRERNHRPSLST